MWTFTSPTAHGAVSTVLAVLLIAPEHPQSAQPGVLSAAELVAELRQFPASLPGVAPSTGVPNPTEQKRRVIYDQLWQLGPSALPALNRGLADPDVRIDGMSRCS